MEGHPGGIPADAAVTPRRRCRVSRAWVTAQRTAAVSQTGHTQCLHLTMSSQPAPRSAASPGHQSGRMASLAGSCRLLKSASVAPARAIRAGHDQRAPVLHVVSNCPHRRRRRGSRRWGAACRHRRCRGWRAWRRRAAAGRTRRTCAAEEGTRRRPITSRTLHPPLWRRQKSSRNDCVM